MENIKTNIGKSACSISYTKMYPGDNNELICVKVYKGDWGHWDEKPETANQNMDVIADSNRLETSYGKR
nr:hypothetical protein [uncultured Flavobacterium sp.]